SLRSPAFPCRKPSLGLSLELERTDPHSPVMDNVLPSPRSHKTGRRLIVAVTYVALVLFLIWFLAPFLWMVSTSLKAEKQVFSEHVRWIHGPILWSNYPTSLASFPFWLYLRNTLYICVMSVIGTVVSAVLPAYGFSRLKWKGRDFLFLVVLMTIM